LRERDHSQDPGVDGRIILKCIFKKRNGGMDWIDMAQDRAFSNTIMSLLFPRNARNFVTEEIAASLEGLCSMDLDEIRLVVGF
jgi:hypothetical protein